MARTAERLSSITVEATSPDGRVKARSVGGQPQALGFRPGSYSSYTEDQLAGQLADLAKLLYVEHERARRATTAESDVRETTDPAKARDRPEAEFLRGLQTISVVGATDNGLVRFKINGMAQWRCRIADGTLDRLSESAFIAETIDAARDLLRKSTLAKIMLKNKHFGSGLIDAKLLDDVLAGRPVARKGTAGRSPGSATPYRRTNRSRSPYG